jgi:RecA/RadA recombinase
MANKNLMSQLFKLEGAVIERRNVHSTVIGSKSPSLNFVYGKGWGLPRGYTVALSGPPKGGKSIILRSMIAQLHADYPESVAVVFNTEFREEGQLSPDQAKNWGIDLERYIGYDVNSPDLIFDRICQEINDLCQKGLDVGLVGIDSITGIQGRRAMNADSVMQQQIGDVALTIQEGLKRVLPVQRKNNIAMVLTTQIRAEMDMAEQMRGNKFKMAASFGLQHHCEYFLWVEPDRTKEGRTDLLGNKFENENLTDIRDNAEKTGHRVRVCMKDSSLGPKGRAGAFTFDYQHGIINTHEEVFVLGVNRGVINHPNNMSYEFGGNKWVGKPEMLKALKGDSELYNAVLKELRSRDLAGHFEDEVKKEESP